MRLAPHVRRNSRGAGSSRLASNFICGKEKTVRRSGDAAGSGAVWAGDDGKNEPVLAGAQICNALLDIRQDRTQRASPSGSDGGRSGCISSASPGCIRIARADGSSGCSPSCFRTTRRIMSSESAPFGFLLNPLSRARHGNSRVHAAGRGDDSRLNYRNFPLEGASGWRAIFYQNS